MLQYWYLSGKQILKQAHNYLESAGAKVEAHGDDQSVLQSTLYIIPPLQRNKPSVDICRSVM